MSRRILLDLDGVLADFVNGACAAHGVNNPYKKGERGIESVEESIGLSVEEFWKPLDFKFWKGLNPYPHYREFVTAIEDKFGQDNICLLTKAPLTESCIAGKVE